MFLIVFITITAFLRDASAGDVVLAWNANTDSTLAGYFLYYGTSSNQYSTRINVGNTTTYTVTGLSNGTYYFSLTAYSATGTESGFASEVSGTVISVDTQPPVISGVTTAISSSSEVTITWSTDEPADTRVEYGTTTAYGSFTSLNPEMAFYHSAGLTGLAANAAYHYRVLSRDASGNSAVSADFVFVTPMPPDTTPPVISSVQSSSVSNNSSTISWTTNEPADGQIEFGTSTAYGSRNPLDESLATTHSSTLSGLLAGTTYHYRVLSKDAAGNLGSSSDYTFLTTSLPDITSGLVAAYSFDEGTGSVAADASGNSNIAALSGVSWTTRAKFGRALSFNGKNSYASAGTAGLPGVSDPKTISCWLYLNTSLSTNQSVIVLANQTQNTSVQHGFKSSKVGVLQYGDTWLVAANQPSSKTWHHYAYVFDGYQHRFYIDGAYVSSSAISLKAAPTSNFQLGRWITGSEYFKGIIDEVRIYNRALNLEEIKAVMNTPIAGSQSDPLASRAMQEAKQDDLAFETESIVTNPDREVPNAESATQPDFQGAVKIRLNKTNYAPGETVSANSFWLSNPSRLDQIVEFKAWISAPGIAPIPIDSLDAAHLFLLPAEFDQNVGSVELFEIPYDLPGGSYQLNIRLISPITGEILFEDISHFAVVRKGKAAPGNPEALVIPELDLELASDRISTSYGEGDFDPMGAFRIVNVSAKPASVELRIWIEIRGQDPVSVFSIGEDRSLLLPAGSSLMLNASAWAESVPDLPAGPLRLKARILDPVTGQTLSEAEHELWIR